MTIHLPSEERTNRRALCTEMSRIPHSLPNVVRLEGTATQSPSILTGVAQVMRQYVKVSGFAMATHARAVSDSFLLGRTTVTIDYQDYRMELAPTR